MISKVIPLFVGCDSYESDVRRLKKNGNCKLLVGSRDTG